MFDNFPLWPERASTAAANVDALFIFLLILSGLMTGLIFTAVCLALSLFAYIRSRGQRFLTRVVFLRANPDQ